MEGAAVPVSVALTTTEDNAPGAGATAIKPHAVL